MYPLIYTPRRTGNIHYQAIPEPEVYEVTDTYGFTHRASSYEWNVAQALYRFGIPFRFQFPIKGGRDVEGGLVLDFLVEIVPLPQPLLVNGDFWHRNRAKEFYYSALIDQLSRGTWLPVITFWGEDAATLEAAERSIRREIL